VRCGARAHGRLKSFERLGLVVQPDDKDAALPCELRWMRRAVFGEPLGAHPPKIGWIGAPGSTHLVERHRATSGDDNCDGEQHGLDAAGTRLRDLPRSSQIGPLSSVRLCTSALVPSEAPHDSGSTGSKPSLVD
jgi:hypothetical protein